jgi:hypothetical protein
MQHKISLFMIFFIGLFFVAVRGVEALYFTIELKNGNTFKIEKYWEEDGNIHFYSHGGSVALPKAKIKTILKHEGTLAEGTIEYYATDLLNTQLDGEGEKNALASLNAQNDEDFANDIQDRIKVIDSNINILIEKKDFYLSQKNKFMQDKVKSEEKIAKLRKDSFITSEDLKERIIIEESQISDAEEKMKEVDAQMRQTDELIENQQRTKGRLQDELAKTK